MAHHTLQSPAPGLPLTAGMKLVLEAIDPTADAAITGVVVTRWSIYGYDESEPYEQSPPAVEWLDVPYTG